MFFSFYDFFKHLLESNITNLILSVDKYKPSLNVKLPVKIITQGANANKLYSVLL